MSNRVKLVVKAQPVAILAALLIATGAQASRDPLDTAFGEAGIVVTPEANGVVTGMVEDRRRRIVAAGVSDTGFVLARYLPNGALDRSFEGGRDTSPGVVRTEIESGGGAFGVAVQANGKIVAAGSNGSGIYSAGLVLARYLPDGRLDPGFGAHGVVRNRLGRVAGAARTVAVQGDGRILVGGYVGPVMWPGLRRPGPAGLLVRYMPDGSIDRSFGTGGELRIRASRRTSVAITDIAVLPSGKILAAGTYGTRLLLARLQPDGTFDRSFGGGDGRTATRVGRSECDACPRMSSLALTGDGGIVLAGSAGGSSVLVSHHADGSIDRSFGDRGRVGLKGMSFFGAARDVIFTRKRRIVVAGGTEYGPRVLRFHLNGRPDRRFANRGVYSRSFRSYSQACAVIEQRDGRLVVGGRADMPPFAEDDELSVSDAQFLLFGLRP